MTRRLAQSDGSGGDLAAARSTTCVALMRALRGELEWIVARCLRAGRDERYPTVNALADDLRACLAGQPVRAAPPARTYRARKFVARHKLGVVVALTALTALVCVSVAMTWLAVRAIRAERLAEDRLRDSEAANARTRAVNNFLTRDVIRSADPFVTPGNRELTMRQALDNAAKVLANRFKNDPLTEAAVRESVGMAYLHLGHPELGQPHGLRMLELRRQVLGDSHPDTLAAVIYYANMLRALGRYAEVEALCGPALNAARRALGEEHGTTLWLHDAHADSLTNLGRYAEAEPLAKGAWDRSLRTLGADSPRTLVAMSNYGRVLQLQGRFAEVEPIFREVLAGGLRIDSPDAPQNLTAMNNLALILMELRRFDEAEALYRDVLQRRRRTLGEDHPQTLLSMGTYATLLERMDRFAEAEPLAREALERSRRTRGAAHPETLRATGTLANILRGAGRAAEAEPLAREALEGRRRVLGEEHPETLASLNTYALVLQALHRESEAEPMLRRVLELRRTKLGAEHPQTRATLRNYADLLSAMGRGDKADHLRSELHSASASTGPSKESHPMQAPAPPAKLIFVTQSLGFVHDVVKRDVGPSRVERVFDELSKRTRLFDVEWTDDVATLTPERINSARLIVFYTTGDLPFTDEQFDAFEQWIKGGGGFLGIHCATDTLANHPRYPKIIGAKFDDHPWNADARVTLKVHAPDWDACKPFGESYTLTEEIYQHRDFDPTQVRVLISLDMQRTELKKPYHVPIAWCREYGRGKVFYTELGHRDDVWTNPKYQEHLVGAIRWLLEMDERDAKPNPELHERENEIAGEAARQAAAKLQD
jgi:type 1 glutamine amidotransferase/tetratricopeptide (TPR) repeat protein